MTIGELKKALEKYSDDESLYFEYPISEEEGIFGVEMVLAVKNDCGTLILEGA